MTDPIPGVSERELLELARTFGVAIDETTAEELRAQVNARLTAGIEQLYEYDLERTAAGATREWSDASDAHNALNTRCSVSTSATGPLSGVDVGLKDNIAVAGIPMRCGSAALRGHVPQHDATVVTRLLESGATIAAKTNLDPFAVGGRGTSFEGTVLNPRDETRSTGGSSGGSAAAVAAGYTDVALGTDTGGSVRMPAAFCGLVGFKPTYGTVPLSGVVENTYALDHVGPITRTVSEAATVLEAIAGADEDDPASMRPAEKSDYSRGACSDVVESPPELSELRLGVLSQQTAEAIADPVARRHDRALAALRDDGVTVEEVDFEGIETIVQVKNAISYCELATGWRDGTVPYRRGDIRPTEDHLSLGSRLRTGANELSDFHRSRLLAGAALVETYDGRQYGRAHEVRRAITEELAEKTAELDAIVTPTVPQLAPKLDGDEDPDALEEGTRLGTGRYTKIANVTGRPAITVPNGRSDGSPIGLQLIGSRYGDAELLGAAARIGDRIESV